MEITSKEVIFLCDDTVTIKPQIDGYAITKIREGSRIHVKFGNADMYLIASNDSKVYFNRKYRGALLVIRHLGEKSNSKLPVHKFWLCGNAVAFSNNPDEDCVSIIGGRNADIVYDADEFDQIRAHFQKICAKMIATDPLSFEMEWGRILSEKPDFRRTIDGISF